MNKKVLKTMIALVIVFLVACYILKIFFPEQFVMSIENKVFIQIGNYIDSHKWLSCIYGIVLGFIFDYLFFGAVCKQKKLNYKLIIIIIVYNIAFSCVYNFANPLFLQEYSLIISAISSCYMILIPMFFTKTIKELSITYCINYISQTLSLNIRNLSLLLTNTNSLIISLMTIESYLWLILLFIYFNYKKEK